MYRPLVRCDQRAKGEQYVRGLLLKGRRESIQPMAARLPDGDEQGCSSSSPTRRGMTWRSVGGWRGG
jgi:SRSO17 transposase